MNRRERVFAVLSGEQPDRTPVGFWMHFSPEAYYGDEAVKTHIRYFEETQTDICKIMNECTYPCEHNIQAAADWKRVKVYDRGADFIQRQADVIRQVVDQVPDAATVATIHGVVASASHTLLGIPRYDSIGRFAQLYHLRTSPEEVWDAYKKIAHTLCAITEESVKAGADGVYYAALGGERDGFTDEEHAKYIAPLDQMVIQAAYDAGGEVRDPPHVQAQGEAGAVQRLPLRRGQLGNPGERRVPAGRTQTVPGPGAPGRPQQSARTADRGKLRGAGAGDPPDYRRGGRAAVYFGE